VLILLRMVAFTASGTAWIKWQSAAGADVALTSSEARANDCHFTLVKKLYR